MNFLKIQFQVNLPQNSYLSLIKIAYLINLKYNVKEKAFEYQIIYKLFRIIMLHKDKQQVQSIVFWISKYCIIYLNYCIFLSKLI